MHEREHERKHLLHSDLSIDTSTPGRSNASGALQRREQPSRSGLLLRKSTRDDNHVDADADAHVERAAASAGSGLPSELKSKFEGSLGVDLSGVRVHTGAASQTAATSVGAKAYTVGQDIHFGANQYEPATPGGQHLIAHEVAHTVQQRGVASMRQHKLEVSRSGDALEHEADRAADAMVQGVAVFGLSSTSPLVARRADMEDNAKAGEKQMGEVAPMMPVNTVSNVTDKQSARALLNIISADAQNVHDGVATKQIDQSVATANAAVSTLLGNYLENADAQTVQISTFQGLFSRLMMDFGRVNQMSKGLDGMNLAGHTEEQLKKNGGDKAKAIFGNDDPLKEKAAVFRVNPALETKLNGMRIRKNKLATTGNRIREKANDVANAYAKIAGLQRAFTAKAPSVKNAEAQKALQDAKLRAKHDYSEAAATILKSALIGAVTSAPGGPGAAAGGGVKAAASSTWSTVIKPKLDEALEQQNISVGKFPDNSAEADKQAADVAAWGELTRIANDITAAKDVARQKSDAMGVEVAAYGEERDQYLSDMIQLGQEMDQAFKTSQNAGRKLPSCEEVCRPGGPPPPPPPPPAKGPRFETALQFIAEADRFVAQAIVTKTQGDEELKVKKDSEKNSASRAHTALEKATIDGTRPSFYYLVSKKEVTPTHGDKYTMLTALPYPFTLHNGLNPTTGMPGADETHRPGSAEGKDGFGANDLIEQQLGKIDDMKAKITALREGISNALGI